VPRKDRTLSYSEPSPWPIGTAPEQKFCGEPGRLAVLASFDMDGLDGDAELSRLAQFAARLCGASVGLVSIVEAQRQRFLARVGIDEGETPREWSFCQHAMVGSAPMVVVDARSDPRFATSPLVTGPAGMRFYAGVPLISSEGAPLGTLCITDAAPRPEGLSALQIEGLMALAEAAKRRLESHRHANLTLAEITAGAERVRIMLDSVPDIAWSAAPGAMFDQFNARWRTVTGQPTPRHVEDWRAVIHPEDYDRSLEKFLDAVQRAEMFEDEIRIRQADGSYRWMLSRAVPSTADPATARWFGTLTDIDDRYRRSQERELLAGELAHRIKNIFAVMSGLVTLHARGKDEVQDFAEELRESIFALSRAQNFALRIDAQHPEDIKDLLAVLLAPYGRPGSSRIAVNGDTVAFGPKAATPLALVFHELATNSAKYGALGASAGQVAITVAREAEAVRIGWSESGGPPTKAPGEEGFGSRLMTLAIERQLGGRIAQDWREQGLAAEISVPLEQLAR
jgi:PAS domain S-box-containing protein